MLNHKYGLLVILLLLPLLFGAGCSQLTQNDMQTNTSPETTEEPKAEETQKTPEEKYGLQKVNFKTSDGVTIAANWFSIKNPKKYILLLHMMPATKESWNTFAKKLNNAGFSALAIDLRGHGESTDKNGQTLNYKNFSDAEHQASSKDIDSALQFLKQKGAGLSDIYIAGASIGANLTITTLAENSKIKKGIALSPGLDYRGVKTENAMKELSSEQNIYFSASSEDKYSYDSTMALQQLKPEQSLMTMFDNAGHGTTILENHPEFIDDLINWLK